MRTEAVSGFTVANAERVKSRFDFLQSQEIKRQLDKIIPGGPTIGKILVAIREDEIKSESRDLLETNTAVHEVLAIAELNDKRIVPGVFVQVQKNCQMEELEWGTRKYMLIREMQVVWVFDRSPKQEFVNIGEQLFETKSGETSIENNAEITPIQVTSGDA